MGKKTGIAWCDHTFSPWWGCERVSAGCAHCYAAALSHRYGHDLWGPDKARRFFPDRHWAEPLAWHRAAIKDGIRRRVFCASMCDVFEDLPTLECQRARLWELIGKTPGLDWLLLTKRPENVMGMAPWGDDWPVNVWLGATAENQSRAHERVEALLRIPARMRFVSAEPLLGPIRFSLSALHGFTDADGIGAIALERVDWLIIGGESGPEARPMMLEWAGDILKQCRRARVPVFVKQLGGHPDKRDDPAKWPSDLAVREFPSRGVRLVRAAG